MKLKINICLFAISTVATLTIGITSLTSCTSSSKKTAELSGPRISIMTFNAENLFDTEHDAGTDDFTFLPLAMKATPEIKKGCDAITSDYRKKECLETDWSTEILKKKLGRVGGVIRQINDGKGPDIVTLIEVENQKVMDMLRDLELKDSGYVTAKVIDSFDPRGIDPGILSRFPLRGEAKIHRIPLKALDKEGEWSVSKTRGILEVPITLPDGTKAVVFAVHFPSQHNPSYLRKQSVEFLNTLVNALPPDVLAIAGGDFNITKDENETTGYYKTILAGSWSVAHLEGCKSCDGTYYYHPKTDWSFLDTILIRQASIATTGWRLDPESVRIPNDTRYQISKYGSPARFDKDSPYGVSDHWPLYAEIVKVTAPPPAAN